MEITSSYQVEILSNTDMKNTVQIYRRTLAFVIDVCDKEWGNISVLGGTKEKDHYVEKLIHPTKNNPNPKYPFDIKGSEFYKFPSYLKRAVIAEAIGAVSTIAAITRTGKIMERKEMLQHYKWTGMRCRSFTIRTCIKKTRLKMPNIQKV